MVNRGYEFFAPVANLIWLSLDNKIENKKRLLIKISRNYFYHILRLNTQKKKKNKNREVIFREREREREGGKDEKKGCSERKIIIIVIREEKRKDNIKGDNKVGRKLDR